MVLVGSYVGLSKLLVLSFPVFLLAWLRFGIAALTMPHWLCRAPGESKLSPREHRLLFLESFFGNFLFSVCMLFGVKHTSALAAGVIMASIPAAVALLSFVLLREHIAPPVRWGIACAVGGIALVSVAGHAGGDAGSLFGNVLLLCAVLCEALYVVIGKRLSGKVSARRITAAMNLWGLTLSTPLALWQARAFEFGQVGVWMWTLLAFYAIAASVVTVWLWMSGLRHVPASSAGVFTTLLPISAAAVGVLFLGERMSLVQMVAYGFALLGVAFATRTDAR